MPGTTTRLSASTPAGGDAANTIDTTVASGMGTLDAAMWRYRGAHSGGTTYVTNDVVLSGGLLWLASAGSTGETPGTGSNWVNFAPANPILKTAFPQRFGLAISDATTDVTVTQSSVEFIVPYTFTWNAVKATKKAGGSGSALIVDIRRGGTSLLGTNKLSIDSNEQTSDGAATPVSFTPQTLTAGDVLTFHFTQVGTAHKQVTVWFEGTANIP